MDKPDTMEKTIDMIWVMLAGLNEDGMYQKFSHLCDLVEKFISNTANVREASCPLKNQFELHMLEHKKKELAASGGKEVTLKKWQIAAAWVAVLTAITLGVLNLIL